MNMKFVKPSVAIDDERFHDLLAEYLRRVDAGEEVSQTAFMSGHPEYAEAWLELGRVQVQNNDAVGARQSFHRSIAADSKFVSPYRELAQLAGHDKQWQELADPTDQLLNLDSLYFPEA